MPMRSLSFNIVDDRSLFLMASPPSSLGGFELVEAIEPLSLSTRSSNGTFQSGYWHSYPFKKDENLDERPWTRPEQIQTSFVGVNVIDVENSRVLQGMTVKISKGLIGSIEKAKPVDMQEDGWTSVDCKGLYMCPGLIDCKSVTMHIAYVRSRSYHRICTLLLSGRLCARPLMCSSRTVIMESTTRLRGC